MAGRALAGSLARSFNQSGSSPASCSAAGLKSWLADILFNQSKPVPAAGAGLTGLGATSFIQSKFDSAAGVVSERGARNAGVGLAGVVPVCVSDGVNGAPRLASQSKSAASSCLSVFPLETGSADELSIAAAGAMAFNQSGISAAANCSPAGAASAGVSGWAVSGAGSPVEGAHPDCFIQVGISPVAGAGVLGAGALVTFWGVCPGSHSRWSTWTALSGTVRVSNSELVAAAA